MKIAKKILISSLAIIPLTTLAFTPSVVRPKKVETCGNNYTQGIWEFPADNSYWVNIAKKLLKEFDMYISPNKTPYLALKIEEIRDEINKKIQKQQEEIEKIEKHKGDCDYAIYTDDLKLHKFYIDCLNSKLKTLRNCIDYDLKILCTVNEVSNSLKFVLQKYKKCDKMIIVIGPEGGFTKEEEGVLIEHGFLSVTLGNLVLRTETASLCALSMINYEYER